MMSTYYPLKMAAQVIIIIKPFLYFLELCETSLQDDPVSFVNTVYR